MNEVRERTYGDYDKDRKQCGPCARAQRENQKPLDDVAHPGKRRRLGFVRGETVVGPCLYCASSLLLHSRKLNAAVMEISTTAAVICTAVNMLCIARHQHPPPKKYDGVAKHVTEGVVDTSSRAVGVVVLDTLDQHSPSTSRIRSRKITPRR